MEPIKRSVYSSSQYDEITFVDIWLTLKNSSKVITVITFLFTFIVLIFVLLMPKGYKTEAVLLPPLQSDVVQMNIISDLYDVTLDEIYNNMLANLQSIALRKEFFLKNNLMEVLKDPQDNERTEDEVFQERFNKLFTFVVAEVRDKELPTVSIFLEGKQADQIADWLNNYIAFVDEFTTSSIVKTLETIIFNQIGTLQGDIGLLIKIAKKQRIDEIVKLEEAAIIAKKVGLGDQAYTSYNSFNQAIQGEPNMNVVINDYSSPDYYLRGYKALKAEAETLKKRSRDEPFITGLRERQEKILFFESIRSKLVAGHSLRVDQKARVPLKSFKPKRVLFVILGFFTGLLVASSIVIVRSLFIDLGRNDLREP